jgi:hypothetical protein
LSQSRSSLDDATGELGIVMGTWHTLTLTLFWALTGLMLFSTETLRSPARSWSRCIACVKSTG